MSAALLGAAECLDRADNVGWLGAAAIVGIDDGERHDAVQRILSSTRTLICQHGPRRVTVNQIATHAGVGKQTIYRWWPTKSALVIDALEQGFEVANPFPDSGSAYTDIRTQMRSVAKTFSSPTGSIIQELVAESQGDPVVAEQFRTRFFLERRRRAAATIRAAITRGEMRSGLNVEDVTDMLYAPIWLRLLIGHRPLSPRAIDLLLDQAWPALSVAPEADHPESRPG